MTEHSKKLLLRIFDSFEKYKLGAIDERGLEHNVAGNLGAIEEKDIHSEFNNFLNKIEDARFLYEGEKGKTMLLEEMGKIKGKFSIQ